MDTYTLISVVLAIIFVLVIYIAILFSLIWIISKVVSLILRIKAIQKLLRSIQNKTESYWEQNRLKFQKLFEYLFEYFIEPILFAYVVFALFNKISVFIEYTKTNSWFAIFQMVGQDMLSDTNFYIVLIVVFFLWYLGKWTRRNKEDRNSAEINKALQANTTVLKAIARKMGVSDDEINTEDIKQLEARNKTISVPIRDDLEGKI